MNFDKLLESFKKSDDTKLVIKEQLTRTERALIHELSKNLGLFSISHAVNGTTFKTITITKTPTPTPTPTPTSTPIPNNTVNTNSDQCIIDTTFIEYFSNLTKIPIPSPLPNMFDYYVELLDPYYKVKWYLEMMKKDVSVIGFASFRNKIKIKDSYQLILKQLISMLCDHIILNCLTTIRNGNLIFRNLQRWNS